MTHKHEHGCCIHCLHHCPQCNKTYCCKCEEEWETPVTYFDLRYPYMSYPHQTGTGITYNQLTIDANSYGRASCMHEC